MTTHTLTLGLPGLLPEHSDCGCCAGHLVEELRSHAGVAARLDTAALVLEVDPQMLADEEAKRLAQQAGIRVAQRYDHPVFAVEGMDCADCAKTIERAMTRLSGVHYATINFTAARLRLEYDREQTSVAAIVKLAATLGYGLVSPEAARPAASRPAQYVCSVEGMCCAAEAGPIEVAVRALPGVAHVAADPALARLSVTYDAQALDAERIVAQVEQLGFRVTKEPGLRTQDQGEVVSSSPLSLRSFARQRPRDALTVLCGVLFITAWLASWLGLPAALATSLYVLATLAGGIFVARSGWATLRATRMLDINMLMSIAALGALLIGEYAEGAAVVFLFALGNALEGYTMDRARRSIRALMSLAPARAIVLRPAAQHDCADHEHHAPAGHDTYEQQVVPIEAVAVGETIVVRPGDRVPLDAVVLEGESALDQAPITGESVPVAKAAGDALFAGSINGEGALEARVTRPAQDSTLARIIHMVEEAQSQKSRAQRFIDVFARYYTPAVIGLAVLVAVLPPLALGGAWAEWFYRALVLLVIACPCALVISTPVSIVSAISAAARAGVLFKGGAALEAAGGLQALAFDKTGTLTLGKPAVTEIVPIADGRWQMAVDNSLSPASDRQSLLLSLAAAVEQRLSHPLARAIVAAAEQRGLTIPAAAGLQSRGGRGASAVVDGRLVAVGNRAMFADAPLPAELDAALHELERVGRTAMLVGVDGLPQGLIAVSDQLRADSRATVAELRRSGIAHIAMLTGDAAPVAKRVAEEVGVDEVRAELLPDQKLAAIGELLERQHSVGMVGDGVNDAPALARATVGIAMGAAGSDAALETADVTLMADDLGKLPFALGLSRAARSIIIQNIAFALAVKAVFLVATLLGAATLWMAVFADTGAALIVIANGMRLLRHRPGATRAT